MNNPKHILTAAILLISTTLTAQTYVSGVISTDTEWTSAGSPYIITDSLIINPPAVLSLWEGTVVMFRYHPDPAKKSYMVVNGGIRANGSASEPVIITSERDDSMGDLNGDGKASLPRPGDWGYIALNSVDQREQEYGFHQTEFRYGGGRNPDTISSPEFYPMLTFKDEIQLDDYEVMYVSSCSLRYSKGTGARMGYAAIYSSTISDCMHGLLLTSSNCALVNSVIENNTGYPVCFNGLKMTLDQNDNGTLNYFIETYDNNTFRDNGQNYFAIGGDVDLVEGDLAPDPLSSIIEWKKIPIPYLVTSPLNFQGLHITAQKGTLVKFKFYPEENRKPYIY